MQMPSQDHFIFAGALDDLSPDPPKRSGDDLELIGKLLDRYPWPEDVGRRFRRSYGALTAKHRDKKLNISVIGEFSTGKSTFINAWLRTQLLAAGALQGTTVATTVLEYGKQHTVAVIRSDGSRQIRRPADIPGVKQALEGLVSENADARSIRTVSVTMPIKALQSSGLRIVDTPGTNATEVWHEGVTVRTIEQISDLSIILVNGTKPLPESFCIFIEENLRNVLDRCVFVVTKLDMIPPRERERMLQYVKMKIVNTFDIQEPKVLPYYSAQIVGSFAPGTFPRGEEAQIKTSLRTEKLIREHTAKLREQIVRQRSDKLLEQMYRGLAAQLDAVAETYQQELRFLERSRSVDLGQFLQTQEQQKVEELLMFAESQRMSLWTDLGSQKAFSIQLILDQIQSIGKMEKLSVYVENELPGACVQRDQVMDRIAKAYYGRIAERLGQLLCGFREDFLALYPGADILVDQIPQIQPLPAPVHGAQGLEETAGYIRKTMAKGTTAHLSGAAAGAAIGTAVVPLVGTVIGGVAGYVGGALLGPKAGAVKQNVRQQVQETLERYFDQSIEAFLYAYDGYVLSSRQYLLDELSQYFETYCHEVDRRIREEEDKIRQVEHQLRELERDKREIRERQKRTG